MQGKKNTDASGTLTLMSQMNRFLNCDIWEMLSCLYCTWRRLYFWYEYFFVFFFFFKVHFAGCWVCKMLR